MASAIEDLSNFVISDDVELGYAEKVESPRLLESHFFVSKIGGKPSWLAFEPLPSSEDLKCRVCSKPSAFLLQVFAPLADKENAFHRSIFIFICRNPECCTPNDSQNVIAFRCQLPRKNDFYSSEPLEATLEFDASKLEFPLKRVEQFSKICAVCGCFGDKRCIQCKMLWYCSKEHQVSHWKLAHKKDCKKLMENVDNSTSKLDSVSTTFENPFLFPEYELVIETELYDEEDGKLAIERSEEERLRDYKKYLETHPNSLEKKSTEPVNNNNNITTNVINNKGVSETNTLIEKCRDDNLDELESVVKKPDKAFKKFQRRIEQNPEQVLRYQRNGQPLWASSVVPDPSDIPNCHVCGSVRTFEFQIMPHLLSYLDVDSVGQSIDWATIAFYTCAKSCDIPQNGYAKEVAFKEDFDE